MKNSSKVLSLFLSTLLLSSTANADFSDVNEKTEYKDSILWMKENNIIKGYEDGSFQPNKCVNRAEFLKMLFKTLEIDSTKSKGELFPDTPESEWYAPYIRTAREHKTIEGYKDGKFHPTDCVSRAEAIKMTSEEFTNNSIPTMKWKFQGMEGMPADSQDSKVWSYKYLEYGLKTNIVGTKHIAFGDMEKDGPYYFKFFPDESMSRKEVAEMLYRIKAIKDNESNYYYDQDKIEFYEQESEEYKFYKPNPLMNKSAEINIVIDQIQLTSVDSTNTSYLSGNTFEFDVYLERTDLKLKEEKNETNLLTVDLPLALQPKLMYMSEVEDTDPESGSMCDRPRFPHRCSETLSQADMKLASKDYLLKITFEDGSYVAKKINVKIPTPLSKPEITFPIAGSAVQNSKFNVTFKDVGADTYDVSATMCEEYKDNGINPCLYEISYQAKREGNTFTLKDSNGTSTNDATVTVKDGQINVKSNNPITFALDMSYTVIATDIGKNTDGVKTLLRTSATQLFTK